MNASSGLINHPIRGAIGVVAGLGFIALGIRLGTLPLSLMGLMCVVAGSAMFFKMYSPHGQQGPPEPYDPQLTQGNYAQQQYPQASYHPGPYSQQPYTNASYNPGAYSHAPQMPGYPPQNLPPTWPNGQPPHPPSQPPNPYHSGPQ